jgi:hypothetical protein
MPSNLIVSKSVIINTPQDKVWNALGNPNVIKEYLLEIKALSENKVGSEMIFHGKYNGHTYRDHKVIFESAVNGKINYSYWSGFPGIEDNIESASSVTYNLFSKTNNQTELTWTHVGYGKDNKLKLSLNGMDAFLNRIKNSIEHLS